MKEEEKQINAHPQKKEHQKVEDQAESEKKSSSDQTPASNESWALQRSPFIGPHPMPHPMPPPMPPPMNDSQALHPPYFSEGLTSYGHQYDANRENRPKLSMLREWGHLISRHKLLIMAIILTILPLVIIEAFRKKSLYLATATIEVRREGSSMKPNDIFYRDSYDNTKSEAFIIKSRPVIEKTVVSLNLKQNPAFLDVTGKRSVWEAITALYGGKNSQENRKNNEYQAVVNETPGAGSEVRGADEQTAPSTLSAAERERLAPYIQTLSDNLNVDSVRETRLLKLSFTHTDPGIAALVANGVAQNYIGHNFQTKTQHFNDASAWLEESTRKLKARVAQAEQKLADYSRENNIFSLEGKENLTNDKLVRMHDQAFRAETDRMLKQSLYEEVKRGRVEQLTEAFADPKTAELRKKLNELEVTASQLSVKFGAKHPKLTEIREQMATLQNQINNNRSTLEEKLKADYERAVREERSLQNALSRVKSEAVQQNQAAIQFSILQQDQVTAKALYTDFLNKTSQVSIQRAEQYNNVRLVEAAESPGGPIGPNRSGMILTGFLLSLALGVGLAWLFENLNTRIRSVEDMSRATQSPLLAVIPNLSEDSLSMIRNELQVLKDGGNSTHQALDRPGKAVSSKMLRDFSVADEAYRMLRTSLLLSTAGHPPRTIMITSAQPGDGKSTAVLNTALAFTKLKTEVLIIDCDMHKPKIRQESHITNEKGLSTYLAGGGNIAEFIERMRTPYLSILPSGPVPPNPSELISSDSMKEMLNSLVDHYDYILIDSPPLGIFTDSLILSTIVDGVIIVAKAGKSKSEVLRRAIKDVTNARAKVLGVILNDIKVHSNEYEYYDNAYRYGNSD
jgi:capsular exopolysaccharide synthesis family protein